MRALQAELIDNPELIEDFGPFRDENDEVKPWALERLTVAKCNRRDPRATIEVFGSGGNVLGKRADWVICDDVVTEKNSATPEQRQKMREWFNLAVETIPEYPESRLTVVGTLFDPQDLYHDIVDMRYPDTGEPIYRVQREDAIVDEEEHTTLWPKRWPWKRLMEQKAKMGTLDFNKRYRNIAVDKSRMVFKEEYVRGGWIGKEEYPGCLDEQYIVGEFEPNWNRFAGFDPAVGLTRSAKFCAHCTIAVGSCKEHEVCYWVVDLVRDQMALPRQADTILELHDRYDVSVSMVEANSYQGGLHQLIDERQNQRGIALRVEPHYTTRTNKPDPESGVQAMSPWFENGKVHIPWGNQESRRKMQQFVDELIQYPGRTTDTVMAFWFAWRCAREQAPRFKSHNRLQKNAPLWHRRLGRRHVTNPYYDRAA